MRLGVSIFFYYLPLLIRKDFMLTFDLALFILPRKLYVLVSWEFTPTYTLD